MSNANTVPNMETMTVHGTKAWTYATVGGRNFKVSRDEEGYCEVRERTGDDTWEERTAPGFDTMAEAILNHADADDWP